MKRKDFYQLVLPLTDKLYRFAYTLIPDDLQAEQLVIDAFNAYLIKERKFILRTEIDLSSKKESQILRRTIFKSMLKYVADIGTRRAGQLLEQMKVNRPDDFASFSSLDAKFRLVVSLRSDGHFSVSEKDFLLERRGREIIRLTEEHKKLVERCERLNCLTLSRPPPYDCVELRWRVARFVLKTSSVSSSYILQDALAQMYHQLKKLKL